VAAQTEGREPEQDADDDGDQGSGYYPDDPR
jgi:hypothetical protein